MFCVPSVQVLNKYYKIFKRKNTDLKIAAIYSYADNVDLEKSNEHPRDELESHIADYNEMFGTNYSTDDFGSYYVDVSKRSKNKQIDLLLVVNMFLTGFDNPLLNTLYVDKNLQYHGLIQAFSRTNRIYNAKKSQGNIVCFRNLKQRTDKAVKLFSDNNASSYIISLPYNEYIDKFNYCAKKLINLVPNIEDVDLLEDEKHIQEFVLTFKNILRILNRVTTFAEFSYDDLKLTQQDLNDYKSKYLDLHDMIAQKDRAEKSSILDDIDFEIELTHQDNINVSYIINLLKELDSQDVSFKNDVKLINNLMQSSHELKSKTELINKFIQDNIVEPDKSIDIDDKLPQFFDDEKNKEIKEMVDSENLLCDETRRIIEEYEYSGKLYDDDIKEAFREQLGFFRA